MNNLEICTGICGELEETFNLIRFDGKRIKISIYSLIN
jgi:hypothetical protein